MPKYVIDVFVSGLVSTTVEAENEEEAIEKAGPWRKWNSAKWLVTDWSDRLSMSDLEVYPKEED